MNDDHLKIVRAKLNQLADQQQQEKSIVMQNVLDKIEQRQASQYGFWKMSGFALAAAIAGFIILPNSAVFDSPVETQAVVTPKLSPQMLEDLEMLLVLGEDKLPHGS